jgi:uncharacterized RDD family membrane protein YckC
MSERFTQTVDIETPELVVVSYTIAGIGSRVYAGLIDLLICIAVMFALIFVFVMIGSNTKDINTSSARMSRGRSSRRSVSARIRASTVAIPTLRCSIACSMRAVSRS